MERKGLARFAPLTGLLFLALAAVSLILGGEPPEVDEPALEQVEFWKDGEGEQIASAIIACYAAAALLWFGGSVRESIARVETEESRLASIAFGGLIVAVTGLLINNVVQFAAAETAEDVSADTTQTLSVLYSDFFFPLAIGLGVFLLASGIAAVRHGAFDRRLGWMAIVIGIVAMSPLGFFGFLAALVWIGIASVVLYRKKDPAAVGGAPPPPSGPDAPPASPSAPI